MDVSVDQQQDMEVHSVRRGSHSIEDGDGEQQQQQSTTEDDTSHAITTTENHPQTHMEDNTVINQLPTTTTTTTTRLREDSYDFPAPTHVVAPAPTTYDTASVPNSSPSPPPSTTTPASTNPPANATNATGDLDKANRLLRKAKTTIDQLKSTLAETREKSERDATALATLRTEADKTRSEYQKYRVRAEVTRQQHQAEIAKLQETNLKYRQYNVMSNDTSVELDTLRRRFVNLEKDKLALQDEMEHMQHDLEAERVARIQAESTAQELHDRLKSPEEFDAVVSSLEARLAAVQTEYDDFRERAIEQLEKKEEELHAVSLSARDTDLAYLRDIILKYMAADDEMAQKPMEAAIATVLRFTPAEVGFIKEKKTMKGTLIQQQHASMNGGGSGSSGGGGGWREMLGL